MRRLASLAATAAALIAMAGTADAVCSRTARNVRLMTLNVACTTGLQSFEDTFAEQDEDRMVELADKIKAWNPDIVVITEALDDGACKDPLVEELKGTYPHYIEEIDDNSIIEDSGLMFFSKLPLVEFPQDVYFGGEGDFEVNGFSGDLTWDDFNASGQRRTIAVHGFDTDECVLGDCAAEKAAAMVRVSGGAGCPINVAFTHMTAVYGDDDEDERNDRIDAQRKSLDSIRKMITGSLTATQLKREPVFLLGDVNIDGQIGLDGDLKGEVDGDHHPLLWPQESPSNTWERIFDPFWADSDLLASGFYACGAAGFDGTTCLFDEATQPHLLTDLAAFEHPRTDLFQTNATHPQNPEYFDGFDPDIIIDFNYANGSGNRLDYILRSHPQGGSNVPFAGEEFVCAQHLRRDRYLDQKALSDHAPVILDAGQNAPRCTPLPQGEFGSLVLSWAAGDPQDKSVDDGNIAYTGNVQWYVIEEKGTYSFATSGDFPVEVYGKADLSTPKHDFMNLTNTWVANDNRVTGPVYLFDDPPYFIKVAGGPSVTPPSAYSLFIHKHGCTNPTNDYCLLKAGALTSMAWPSGTLISYPDPAVGTDAYYQDQAYFMFGVVDASGGALPEIDFLVQDGGASPLLDPPSTDEGSGVRIFRDYDFALCDCNSGDHNSECDPTAGLCNAPIELASWDEEWKDDLEPLGAVERTGHTDNRNSGVLKPDTPGTAKKHFLRVSRRDVDAFDMFITYLNTLTTWRGTNVYCEIQNDTTGDDEILVHPAVDGAAHASCDSLAGYISLGDFDEESGGSDKAALIGTRRFASDYDLKMCEEDTAFNGDNDSLSDLGGSSVSSLPLDVSTVVGGTWTFADEPDFDDRDYSYQVNFELVHEDESLNLQ
jgi:hypothetical protein